MRPPFSTKICALVVACGLLSITLLLATTDGIQANSVLLRSSRPYPNCCASSVSTVTIPAKAASSEALDNPLRQIIVEKRLTGDPAAGRNLPSIEEPIAQLGKKLFFTKVLGGDMDVACASCHLPTLGGGDGLPMSIGVGAHDPDLVGPGRTHPEKVFTVPRNAPTTFNIAMWDKVLFHDGRVESLGGTPGANGADGLGIRTPDVAIGEIDANAGANLVAAQSRFPTTSPDEMRGFAFAADQSNQQSREKLAARLANYNVDNLSQDNHWRTEFEIAFGPTDRPEELITEQRMAQAIGEYERSQVFVETPWKAYVEGDLQAIDPAAKRGALLFFSSIDEGGANCASCHGGDFFTDEAFHVLAVPQIGLGKGDGVNRTDDYGRFRETRHLKDLYAFRTPSLLNVTVTGPWGHDGAYATLEGMVRHTLNPVKAIQSYDWTQLDDYVHTDHAVTNTQKALARLEHNRRKDVTSLENVDLTDLEVSELLAFLETLTDPCVTDPACLAPWMPTDEEIDGDNYQLLVAKLTLNNR